MDEVEIVGVELWGPPPIARVRIPLDRPVAVLYGRNGAGKTQVLQAIRRTLSGSGHPNTQGVLEDALSIGSIVGHEGIDAVGSILIRVAAAAPMARHTLTRAITRRVAIENGSELSFEEWTSAVLLQLWDPRDSEEEDLIRGIARSVMIRLVALADGLYNVQLVIDALACPSALMHDFDEVVDLVATATSLRGRYDLGDDSAMDELETVLQRAEASVLARRVLLCPTYATPMQSLFLNTTQAASQQWAESVPDAIELTLPWELEAAIELQHLGISCSDVDAGAPETDLQATLDQIAAEPRLEDILGMADGDISGTGMPMVSLTRLLPDGSVERVATKGAVLDDEVLWSPKLDALDDAAVPLAARANELFALVLEDPPTLAIAIERRPAALSAGEPGIEWLAVDRYEGTPFPLFRLSTAERRWARVVIGLAQSEALSKRLAESRPGSVGAEVRFLVVDEPEQALHAAAQKRLADGLHRLRSEVDAHFVVASHSAALLNMSESRLLHVQRTNRGAAVSPVPSSQTTEMLKSDLSPEELLLLTRCFLLVEGHHDQLILTTLLGSEFERDRVHLMPMNGAHRLAEVVDSKFLFTYTDARVVIALDNVDGPRSLDIWQAARQAARTDTDSARTILEQQLNKKVNEERVLREFGISAIERGVIARVGVFCVGKADIIEYLPVAPLVARAKGRSWAQLRAKFEKSQASATRQGPSFKVWLGSTFDGDFSDGALVAACAQMDHIPDDFTELLRACGRS